MRGKPHQIFLMKNVSKQEQVHSHHEQSWANSSATYHEETLELIHNHVPIKEENPQWRWMMIMNDLYLIYTFPNASSRVVLADLNYFLLFSLYLSSSTFLGSCSLFNGPHLSSINFVFICKKYFHELVSQLMSSPHMHLCLFM